MRFTAGGVGQLEHFEGLGLIEADSALEHLLTRDGENVGAHRALCRSNQLE